MSNSWYLVNYGMVSLSNGLSLWFADVLKMVDLLLVIGKSSDPINNWIQVKSKQ